MDLSTLAIKKDHTEFLQLEHPVIGQLWQDEEKTVPVTIELYSPSSDKIVRYEKRMLSKALTRHKKNEDLDANLAEENRITRLIEFTSGVNGLEIEGVTVTTEAQVRKIYANKELGWIHEQVEAKLKNWKTFLSE